MVLSDEEIAAQMRAVLPSNESEYQIEAALNERQKQREAIQRDYDKGAGAGIGPLRPSPQTIYPVKENLGPVTAVYDPKN